MIAGFRNLTKKSIRENIEAGVVSINSKSWWGFDKNEEPDLPERKIVISRSPWFTKEYPDFCVTYHQAGKLVDCENGVGLDDAVKAVVSWYHKGGFA